MLKSVNAGTLLLSKSIQILLSPKPHSLLSTYFAVVLFPSILACSPFNRTTSATFQNGSVVGIVEEQAGRTLDCRNAHKYSFVVVANPKRKNDSDPLIPKDLNIVIGDEVISKIELPTADSVKNFSLNSIKKKKGGFEIKVDWGGGLHHYEIQFDFKCKKTGFYLYEVRKDSFSTSNPDSGNFLDKKETKVTKIEPNLPIEKFLMTDYL